MSEFMIQETTLKGIADAIREKNKTTDEIAVADMPAKIKEVPHGMLDTSQITDWSHFFRDGVRLECREVAGTMSKGTDFTYCFYGCADMIDGGTVDMSNITYGRRTALYMFANCTNMTDLTIIAKSLSTWALQRMFYYTSPTLPLTNLTINGTIKVVSNDLTFVYCPYLTHDSLLSILNSLEDNTGGASRYTVYFGADNLAKLTDEEKAIAENKNITLQ